MDECKYQTIQTQDENRRENLKYFLRQFLISSTVWVQYFNTGLSVGATTVIVAQLKAENASMDQELISWIYSTTNFATLPWVFILPFFTKLTGRKLPQFVNSVITITAFVVMYYSSTVYHIIVSEALQGYFHAANLTFTVIILTDYSSVRHRGVFLSTKSACFFWGVWLSNAIGTFYHWKNIALVGIACSLYTFNVIVWPESPFWLASKGKIEKCKTSYRWLFGANENTEIELRKLISTEFGTKDDGIGFFERFRLREFYEPLILSLVSVGQYHFTAKTVCSLFILDILMSITGDETSAYFGMLILDGVTVFAMYLGSYLVKVLKRRTILMPTSYISVAILFIISLYIYLIRWKILVENNYVLMVFISVHSIASCGPILLSVSMYGELISARFQDTSYTIIASVFCLINMVTVKFMHRMLQAFDVSGTFILFGVTCGLCTFYMYMFLPETKNKTLSDIEELFKSKKRVNNIIIND